MRSWKVKALALTGVIAMATGCLSVAAFATGQINVTVAGQTATVIATVAEPDSARCEIVVYIPETGEDAPGGRWTDLAPSQGKVGPVSLDLVPGTYGAGYQCLSAAGDPTNDYGDTEFTVKSSPDPTPSPTPEPTVVPTPTPTVKPTVKPSPTTAPTVAPSPTVKPSPTTAPTAKPGVPSSPPKTGVEDGPAAGLVALVTLAIAAAGVVWRKFRK